MLLADECRVRSVNSSLGVPESGERRDTDPVGEIGETVLVPQAPRPEFSFYRDLARDWSETCRSYDLTFFRRARIWIESAEAPPLPGLVNQL